MSKTKFSTAGRLRRTGYAAGAATILATLTMAAPAYAVATATVSPVVGPTGGTNTIAVTTTTALDAEYFATGSVQVQFSFDTCATNFVASDVPVAQTAGTVDAGIITASAPTIRVFSKNKFFVTVPASLALPGGATVRYASFNVCVYDTTNPGTSVLLASATGGDKYKISDVAQINTVTPITGAAQGGDTVTITGVNLVASGTTAAIDGQPLTGVAFSGNAASGTLTGKAPARSAGGPFTVTVTTPGGLSTPKAGAFSYTNGIRITPNTAPNTKTTGTDIDITGVGFQAMDWTGTKDGGTPNSATAHVYLVNGVYDPKASGTATFLNAPKTNGQVAECQDVTLISDMEVICTLYTAGNGVKPLGAAGTHTGLSGSTATATSTTLVVTGGTLTQNDVGAAVTGTGIANGVFIRDVTGANTATLNKVPNATPNTALSSTVLTLFPARTVSAVRTQGSTAVTSAAQFLTTDVGRPVFGPGIPNGATIASVGDTSNLVLSAAASAAATGSTFQIGTLPVTTTPIPNGTYTMTVVNNGASDVQTVGATRFDANFSRSIVSSGSTFTVADY